MENSNPSDKNYNCDIFNKKPFLEFHLKRKLEKPIIFNTNIFEDINESESKKIIIQPDVAKSIIGKVLIDYKVDMIKKINLLEIYKILGYIQIGRVKTITKFGILIEYCVFDINKSTIIMFLFSQKIIYNYFNYPKENLSRLHVVPIVKDNIEKLCTYREYPDKEIIIDIKYLKKLYNDKVKNLEEGLSLSQKVCCMIPDP